MQHRLNYSDTVTMFLIMIISGLLSAMYLWADSITDVRVSLNDVYMAFLMASWMLVAMAIISRSILLFILGALFVLVSLFFIRYQLFITQGQYVKGMIPHHSMAVFMSKKLLMNKRSQRGSTLEQLAKQIIKGQQKEILILKSLE